MSNVLIVCVGNICRSPMAEFLLRNMVSENTSDMTVSSAGLGALVGHPADENVLDIMTEKTIDISSHRARQLDERMVRENELILVMEYWQQKEIEQRFPFSKGRVHLLGKWNDYEIEDPYKKSRQYFVDAYEKIDRSCQEWGRKLS